MFPLIFRSNILKFNDSSAACVMETKTFCKRAGSPYANVWHFFVIDPHIMQTGIPVCKFLHMGIWWLNPWRNPPVATYSTYLRLMLWLKGWSMQKILMRVHHRKSARRADRTSGTLCSLVSCSRVWCTHQNHFSRPATAFISFSALILLNHDE